MRQQPYPSRVAQAVDNTSSRSPHRYSPWSLALLWLGVLFWIVNAWIFPNPKSPVYSAAILAYLAVIIGIVVLDWRHILDLHGNVNWSRLSWPGRVGIAFLYALLTVLLISQPILYLAFAGKDMIADRRGRPNPRAIKTAQLEADLGMMPGVDGECMKCHKPLQAGAEFCAYCGAAVVVKPRVCPRCAVVVLPDAQFCPKCGTSFSPPSATTVGP